MSYMSMTIYNIYSVLFIIVYIVCIIVYLLILYVGIIQTIQMKSSMTFIQSNGWTEIDLILKQIWRWFI